MAIWQKLINTLQIYIENPEKNKTYTVDFVLEKENIKEYTPIASISSIFLKDIIARFSAYYARQGQPNLMWIIRNNLLIIQRSHLN